LCLGCQNWHYSWSASQWHTGAVYSVTYSHGGQHIASGSCDNTIQIWDAITGNAVGQPLKGHTDSELSVVYSPDGQHIVSRSDNDTIQIWDAKTGNAAGVPLEGTLIMCSVQLTPLMGSTLYLDLIIIPFVSGTPKLAMSQSASQGTHWWCVVYDLLS
jgi:WD40 repeat protein